MASVQKRSDNKFYVIYSIKNPETGKYDTPWIPFEDEASANKYKEKIELELAAVKKNRKGAKSVSNPTRTVEQLIWHYVDLVGKNKWGVTTFPNNVARIKNYILPHIGDWRVWECTALKLDSYFAKLKTLDAVQQKGKGTKKVSPKTINEIHKFLKACFRKAVRWEMMDVNPCAEASDALPVYKAKKKVIWTRDEFLEGAALAEKLPDLTLCTALHIAVSTTLREGEICGLTAEDIFVSDEDIVTGNSRVVVTKELERVDKATMKTLDYKDIIHIFPDILGNAKSSLVLKRTKTEGSERVVWLPGTAARMVQRLLIQIKELKDFYGDSYKDYGLLMSPGDGRPLEPSKLNNRLSAHIQRNDLKRITFHSLRHTSISYKLRYSNGNIKSVQGDSGHQTAQMVTDNYAEIIEEDRKENAVHFEHSFYLSDLPCESVARNGTTGNSPSPQEIAAIVNLLQSNPDILRGILSATAGQLQPNPSNQMLLQSIIAGMTNNPQLAGV